jgi:hypothetical protein
MITWEYSQSILAISSKSVLYKIIYEQARLHTVLPVSFNLPTLNHSVQIQQNFVSVKNYI